MAAGVTARPPTVLAIDDDRQVLAVIRAHLTAAGYRVLEATDGESGLRLAHGGEVDLITLDVLMAPLSGRDVLARLRADIATHAIQVVLVTVVDRPGELPADGYVSKPFRGRRLLDEVQRLLPA